MSVIKYLTDTHGNVMTMDEKGKTAFSNETVILDRNLYGTNDVGSLLIVGRPGTPISKQHLKRGLANGSLSYSADDFHRNRRAEVLAEIERKKLGLGKNKVKVDLGESKPETKPFLTTKAHVTAAQNFLVEQKFFEGEVSGKMTDDFREALKVWQAKNELEETGTLNQVTFESMKIELEKSE